MSPCPISVKTPKYLRSVLLGSLMAYFATFLVLQSIWRDSPKAIRFSFVNLISSIISGFLFRHKVRAWLIASEGLTTKRWLKIAWVASLLGYLFYMALDCFISDFSDFGFGKIIGMFIFWVTYSFIPTFLISFLLSKVPLKSN
jgi:hypothetical protein